MPTIAHYEIYSLEDTGWVLRARFVSAERAKALEEAQSIDNFLGRPTKVVRETYDTATEAYSDQTVFLSPRAQQMRRAGRDLSMSATGVGSRAPSFATGSRPNARIPNGLDAFGDYASNVGRFGTNPLGAPPQQISTSDLAARVMFVVIGSLVIATSGTALIPVVISLLRNIGLELGDAALSKTLFSAFLVIFIASGFFLTLRLVPIQSVLEQQSARSRWRANARAVAARKRAAAQSMAGNASKSSDAEARRGEPASGGAESPAKGAEAERARVEEKKLQKEQDQDKEKDKDKDKDRERELRIEKEREQEKERKKKNKRKDGDSEADDSSVSNEQDGAAGKDKDQNQGSANSAEQLSPAFSAARDVSMAFLGTYVGALKAVRPKLDTFNRFGINLYLAGVCGVIAKTQGLNDAEFEHLLRETVEIMGTRKAQAASFVARLKSYLEEPRYSEMVQHGREAMLLQRKGGPESFDNLGMVIEDWNTPKTQKITGSTIAIVFTDIVGSTDMTSKYGDVKAQQILRAHNAAVRAALARFSGREIKHTGDGIMATFEHVPDAVWGMIDVLKAVQAHNQSQPEIPLRIRIGINAGEPISAENDYYGLAVTLAARICAEANMNQILVSQVVRDLCEGTQLAFGDHGAADLKGIKDPQPLHEALWAGSPTTLAAARTDGASSAEDGAGVALDQPPDQIPPEPILNAEEVFDPNAESWTNRPSGTT